MTSICECSFSPFQHLIASLFRRISNIIAAAHVDTESEYNSKRDMYNELGKFCVAYVEKFSLWYRVEILDWFLVCTLTKFCSNNHKNTLYLE